MFKITLQTILLVEVLIARVCADIHDSQEDLESDIDQFPDRIDDQRTRLDEQLQWPQPPGNESPGSACQTKVAFSVGLAKNFGPVKRPTFIVFDTIITNIGSGYLASPGAFQAPVTGTYQFSVTVAALHTKSAAVNMYKSGTWVMLVWSEARPNWAPASNVIILSLNAGDLVWLQVGDYNWPSYVFGHQQTTFSGFLIFEN